MNHQGTITLETDHLILRKLNADDIPAAFRNWTSDDKVTEFLRWPTHSSIAITERVINDWIAEYEKPEFYQWAIVPKDLNEPIGTIITAFFMGPLIELFNVKIARPLLQK